MCSLAFVKKLLSPTSSKPYMYVLNSIVHNCFAISARKGVAGFTEVDSTEASER